MLQRGPKTDLRDQIAKIITEAGGIADEHHLVERVRQQTGATGPEIYAALEKMAGAILERDSTTWIKK